MVPLFMTENLFELGQFKHYRLTMAGAWCTVVSYHRWFPVSDGRCHSCD